MNPQGDGGARSGGALRVLFVALVFLVVILVVGWIVLLPRLVKGQVQSISGFPVEASRISANPFGATILVEGFSLNNPDPFPVRDFVRVRSLNVKVKPLSLTGERVEIPHLVVDLEKITLVTRKDGMSNARLLKQNIDKAMGEPSSGDTGEKAGKPFHIGLLQVKLGSIELIDYSRSESPAPQVVVLAVDRSFTDVTDPKVVVGPIVADILKANLPGIAEHLSGYLPEDYSAAAQDAFRGLGSMLDQKDASLEEKAKTATDSAKKLFDSLKGGNKP